MRVTRLLCAAVLAAGTAVGVFAAVPTAQASGGPDYYLALGDSLSVGVQVGFPDGTGVGYTDDLYTQLHAHDAALQLAKLGCPGETTATMINGACPDTHFPYPAGHSQLAAAVAFLHAHAGHVKYLTIDIGANDVDGCASGGSINAQCVAQGAVSIAKNLDTILCALRAADGGHPISAGMSYYDPFLAEWLTGTSGQAVATASVALLTTINTAEATEFTLYGFRTADVFDHFQTANFLPLGTWNGKTVPVNVATLCKITWMCTNGNIHANAIGYGVIADAFADVI